MVGPIPAKAGEPGRSRKSGGRAGAYPREGGGTRTINSPRLFSGGLSPRRRGNHTVNAPSKTPAGPIPAKAGEPLVDSPLIYKRKH